MPEVVVTDEFKAWYEALLIDEQQSVFRVVTLLEGRGVAVLLLGGDKGGNDRFYEQAIPRAEALWERYLAERSTEREE